MNSDDDVDEAIAREVFGCTQQQIDAWPFGTPAFCGDRNYAADVVSGIWTFAGLREAFERHLSATVPRLLGGPAESLFACTSGEICQAALMAFGEYGSLTRCATPGSDGPPRDAERADLGVLSPSLRKTPSRRSPFVSPADVAATA